MTTKEAVDKLRAELKADQQYYYAWQSNIAMAMMDELHRRGYRLPGEHEMANEAAKSFLSNLLRDTTDEDVRNN